MGGLLYKDFVAMDRVGKVRQSWVFLATMMIFIVFRIIFPGTKEYSGDLVLTNDQGITFNLVDLCFMMFYSCYIISFLSLMSVANIIGKDEKCKVREYLNAMPIEKNTYVASKYVFVGITAYVTMSIDYIFGIICVAFCQEGYIQDIGNMINSFIVSFVSIGLFMAAIEFPLYIRLGKEKAMRVMIVLLTMIALIFIGYLMFGDLSVIENYWNIIAFMNFVDKHKTGILIFQSVEPVIVLALYYVSYRLSCYLYNKMYNVN